VVVAHKTEEAHYMMARKVDLNPGSDSADRQCCLQEGAARHVVGVEVEGLRVLGVGRERVGDP
jgi:hypothetical protein